LVDLLPQTTPAEGMPHILVVGARYVKWIAAGTRFRLQVARRPPPRLDLGELGHLASVDVGGRSQTEGEGLVTRCLLTVYFGTPNMFITLWFGFDYGTNLPLGTLII
jgi:hypothetical protein